MTPPTASTLALARRLGIQAEPLRKSSASGESKVKIIVFVPDKDLAKVSEALFAAGAGKIGNYRECSFRIAGTGTFFGLDGTNPTVGKKLQREEAPEWRLEVVCPTNRLQPVVELMRLRLTPMRSPHSISIRWPPSRRITARAASAFFPRRPRLPISPRS